MAAVVAADSKSANVEDGVPTATASAKRHGKLAIIGGSSFMDSQYFKGFQPFFHDTPFGRVRLRKGPANDVIFVMRHNTHPTNEYTPPHLLNPRAVIHALKDLGVDRVVAFASVGALTVTLPLGSFVVPDDYFAPALIISFFEDARAHKIPQFNDGLRKKVITAVKQAGFHPVEQGVYAQTFGPRFETPSEIRALARDCHIVGMTCASEATLCNEIDLPYAVVAMVDNYANGVGKILAVEEWRQGVKNNLTKMETALGAILKYLESDVEPADKLAVPLTQAEEKKLAKVSVDLVVHAKFIIPVEQEGVLEDYALVVNKGIIVDILPQNDANAKYTGIQTLYLQDSALMPGLVNAHTHMGMTLLRGYSDDKCLHDWLSKDIWPAEAKFVSPEFVRDSTLLACAEMIRGGTITVNDMHFFPLSSADAIAEVGLRALVGLAMLDFPSAYAKNFDDYVAQNEKVRQKYVDHPLVKLAYAPHAPYTVCDDNLVRVGALAKQHNLRIHVHLHETKAEREDSINGTSSMACHRSSQKTSPLANFHRLGLLSDNLIAVHMTQLSEEEIKLVQERKVNVVHCPTSNMKLSSGFCPTTTLTKNKVTVALGTDSSASNNSLDMFYEMKLAALLAKGSSNDPTAVPAPVALRMATLDGARALGMESFTGSLKVGKSADFIAVNFDSFELLPIYEPVSHIVYSTSRDRISHVWVAGRCLLNNRKLQTINETELLAKIKNWNAQLKAFHQQK